MKTFLRFLSEAPDPNRAKEQARKLNLKSDGHGGWLDSKGEFVAKTEGGKLKFYNQRQRAGQDPPQPKGVNTPVATYDKRGAAAQAPAAKPKSAEGEGSELDKAYMEEAAKITSGVTVYYGRMNGAGKGVNMTCESKHYNFTFNIRNKQGGLYPTHVMCDYKKKKAGDVEERPQDGGADYEV